MIWGILSNALLLVRVPLEYKTNIPNLHFLRTKYLFIVYQRGAYFVTKSWVCSLLTTIGNCDIGGDITEDDNNRLVQGPAVSSSLS